MVPLYTTDMPLVFIISQHKSLLNVLQIYRNGLKVMAPILLHWTTTFQADASGMKVQVQPSLQEFVSFVAVRQLRSNKEKWHVTWKRIRNRGMSLNFSMW
jgi:hypothetical protein